MDHCASFRSSQRQLNRQQPVNPAVYSVAGLHSPHAGRRASQYQVPRPQVVETGPNVLADLVVPGTDKAHLVYAVLGLTMLMALQDLVDLLQDLYCLE